MKNEYLLARRPGGRRIGVGSESKLVLPSEQKTCKHRVAAPKA
jgi:hypothetical protein